MASLSPQQQQDLALSAGYEDDTPTPLGWRRKLIPHIGKGLVPARTDVIFIAPNGEEFKTKAQLQRYLKSNKGSPSLSEFIWITDETPRRSSRSASKRSKSPPKSANKKKHVAEIPLEESKATKRKQIVDEEDVGQVSKGDKSTYSRKAGKVAPIESKDDMDGAPTSSPPASNAKDSKKKPIKDTKKKKGTQITTQSTEVTSNAHMSANDNRAHMSEKHENGKDEAVEENGNKKIMEEKEETMEEPISHKQVPVMTKNIEIEEHADSKDKDTDKVHDEHMDNQGSKDADGDCDGTTTSMLGSDLSAEGMEAESEIFESEKKERPLCEKDAGGHVEKDDNDNTPHDCAKDAVMHQENDSIEAAK